jgi:hypothetical protein
MRRRERRERVMDKIIVTLRSAPAASVDVPKTFPKLRGAKEGKPREIARSCFGALRFFPGVPKAITKDELEFLRRHHGEVAGRLDERPYVESKRLDYRGVTEADLAALAEKEGVGHLKLKDQVARLQERGKLGKPDPKKSSETRLEGKGAGKAAASEKPKAKTTENGNGGTTSRKPR